MAEVTIRPRAERDLEEIWRYTERRWSRAQALIYLGAIRSAFAALAANEALGRSADTVRPGYFRHRVQSHIIFFKRAAYGVEIVRVLHQSMDIEARLGEE